MVLPSSSKGMKLTPFCPPVFSADFLFMTITFLPCFHEKNLFLFFFLGSYDRVLLTSPSSVCCQRKRREESEGKEGRVRRRRGDIEIWAGKNTLNSSNRTTEAESGGNRPNASVFCRNKKKKGKNQETRLEAKKISHGRFSAASSGVTDVLAKVS